MPAGGLRMVESSLGSYGYAVDPLLRETFNRRRKTHNDGVFDAYTPQILAARRAHIVTGLPDAYQASRRLTGRGCDRALASSAVGDVECLGIARDNEQCHDGEDGGDDGQDAQGGS